MTSSFEYYHISSFSVVLLCFCTIMSNGSAIGQPIIADQTVGSDTLIINPNSDLIIGGARPNNGANLFHSFKEFSVKKFHSVYFDNPTGVERIIARVTGDQVSRIDGKLGVTGAADLFFINPNGIVFGSNSSLDLRGIMLLRLLQLLP
jgi:filamentous hemagglutinin family protein